MKQDSVYVLGYESEKDTENPYEQPLEEMKITARLAVKDELSDSEMAEMVKNRDFVSNSEWSRWDDGKFTKEDFDF